MRLVGSQLVLTATDLASFLGCRHRTALEMGEAHGLQKRPRFQDPLAEILRQRGVAHEQAYVRSLVEQGRDVLDLTDERDQELVRRTTEALRAGQDVVVQGGLGDARFRGRPDVLLRCDRPSALGSWSYEVADTKLARETRAGTLLQLGLYSEMLQAIQGTMPSVFRVVTPDTLHPIHEYRIEDYAAYFRSVRGQLETFARQDPATALAAGYPDPVEHCDICPWSSRCSARRRADDHLSLVAGISRVQRRELEPRGIATLTALAGMPVPLPFKPRRGSRETYVGIREQARVQLASRGLLFPVREARKAAEGLGLARLPEPSPGDIFLDLEGDTFAREGGREYLFGLVTIDAAGAPRYQGFWAVDDAEERRAFEEVVDIVAQAVRDHPGTHVYHYAPYEPSALKRLSGRYASRQQELDVLLRSGRFVDLYGVVRQSMWVGIDRYSIKNLEVLYGFDRAVALETAGLALRAMEHALELECPQEAPPEVREAVEGYNRDDCVSTWRLREWLEKERAAAIASGTAIARPVPQSGEASEDLTDKARRVEALRARLLDGLPESRDDRSPDQQARWLLAYLLDWHRREDKATWWEYYRLRDLPPEDQFDEPQAIAGMELAARLGAAVSAKTGKATRSVVDRYQYPPQEMEIAPGDTLKAGARGETLGEVVAVDRAARTIDISKGPKAADDNPPSVFAFDHVPAGSLETSLLDLGERVADTGLEAAPPAARDLLLAAAPRLRGGAFGRGDGEDVLPFAIRAGLALDDSVLAIQGPPGSGKTHTGAAMICALVAAGKRIGVAATSHKVVEHLLRKVAKAAAEDGQSVRLGQRYDDADEGAGIARLSNDGAEQALHGHAVDVVGGTAWLWARDAMADSVDVLFVDEAGQMALANVLAMARAAGSLVLLGDPQQLEQPQKGTHPDGVGASALEHILAGHPTIPDERGIFLRETWRLSPRVCAFTSELFYEGRLASRPDLERQRLVGGGGVEGSGLRLLGVAHEGNRSASSEEAQAVKDLVEQLTAGATRWVDRHGVERPLTRDDVLIVAPYNAQVGRLRERLGEGARIGTVDKFQGQEAPVVIYSMATSHPDDAPRGMEFLYSLNRLNVATSRARCVAIVVASPRLFEPECRSPRQMRLANALCRFREMAAG